MVPRRFNMRFRDAVRRRPGLYHFAKLGRTVRNCVCLIARDLTTFDKITLRLAGGVRPILME